MTASATLTLYHARAARSAQSKVKVAREDRAFFQNSQSADGGNRQVTEVRHRADIGSVPAANGNGHFSAERNNFHDNHLSLTGSTYPGELELSFTSKRRIMHRNLTDQVIAEWLAAALNQKARKIIAHAADTCLRTVNEWCLARRLPNAAALIRLMAHDDDVFLAIMEMSGRDPGQVLSEKQKIALCDAMKILGIKE